MTKTVKVFLVQYWCKSEQMFVNFGKHYTLLKMVCKGELTQKKENFKKQK